jgi:AraC family transcriptional regulator, transcriptional activator of pobA
MKFHYTDLVTKGEFHLVMHETTFDRLFFQRDFKDEFLTIAWNKGPKQMVTIDEVRYDFSEQGVLPMMINQSFRFEKPEQVVAWQFNRNFYCIIDHDREVSCVGFIFYGSTGTMFIDLNEHEQHKIDQLLAVFIDEFQTADNIQKDMLLMLLKRLIIILTRLAKKQYVSDPRLTDDKLDIVRRYNLLVENHYHKQHYVQFYADQLHKSPKTLANLFALYNHKSPLAIIQERIVLEAQRLLIYTDKSAKEIAYHLGFEDTAYFSNFFKKHTAHSPQDFRHIKTIFLSGQ